MIKLYIYDAQTFYEGDPDALEQYLYPSLRVKDKNAFWKARAALRRLAYFYGTDEEKAEQKEKIIESAQYVKFYDGRSKSFGTGLLPRVLHRFRKHDVDYNMYDKRKKVAEFKTNIKQFAFQDTIESREEQLDVLRAALEKKRGILHCATNFGKTEVAAAIIAEFNRQKMLPNVLFLVHRIQLAKQTADRFKKHLMNIPVAVIGGGQKKIPEKGVLVATIQTAMNSLDMLEKFLERCDILLIDEFHINKAWSCSKIAKLCQAPMRFGLSGTIRKENKIKMLHYVGMTGPIIAEVRNEELVEKGRSAKPIARFVEVRSEDIPKRQGYAYAYVHGIVLDGFRNSVVVRETVRHLKRGRRVLVTVSRINHGRELLRMLERQTDLKIEFIHGGTPVYVREKVLARFKKHKVQVLIASPIFDVGMDVPEIEAWVNAAGGVGWELVLQRLGRVLRRKEGENKVYISDFVDLHNEYLMRHSLARIEHYQNEKIVDIKIVEAK